MTFIPQTWKEWRFLCPSETSYPREAWANYENLFLQHGLTLWKLEDPDGAKDPKDMTAREFLIPPNSAPRTFDGFAYATYFSPEGRFGFQQTAGCFCPARNDMNQDFMIRLVAKGDVGRNHLTALRRLATGSKAFFGENHTLPVLKEIEHEDMVFAVFPKVDDGFEFPWFDSFEEILESILQLVEGVKFCHDNLVSHLDIHESNFLINIIGGSRGPRSPSLPGPVRYPSFRSLFPVRYYLHDFELAVCFDLDSSPESRRIIGIPAVNVDPDTPYCRATAPEMSKSEAYCPFKADMWLLGEMLGFCFCNVGEVSEDLQSLIQEMKADSPEDRPSASEALVRVKTIQMLTPVEKLKAAVRGP